MKPHGDLLGLGTHQLCEAPHRLPSGRLDRRHKTNCIAVIQKWGGGNPRNTVGHTLLFKHLYILKVFFYHGENCKLNKSISFMILKIIKARDYCIYWSVFINM